MLCKVSYQGQNKIIKLKQTDTLSELHTQVPKFFPQLTHFQLYYLDQDQDQISLTIEEDLQIFKEKKKANFKIYLRKKDNFSIIQSQVKPIEQEHSKRSEQTSFSRRVHSRTVNEYSSQRKEEFPSLQDSRRRQFLLRQPQIQQRSQYRYKEIKRQEIHEIKCSKCKANEIIGIRYQCPFCLNFNICEVCQKEDDHMHSLVKVKKAKNSINYQQLRNHLNLQFPESESINKEKEMEQLRKNYSSLQKILLQTKRKEQVNKNNRPSSILNEKQRFEQKFDQKWRQSKRLSDQIGKEIDSKFNKQSARSREKYNYQDYRSYYHSQDIPLQTQIERRKRILYPYSNTYRF